MISNRRDFLKKAAAGAVAVSGGWGGLARAADAETIVVGGLHDLSGDLQLFGTTKCLSENMLNRVKRL